MKRKVAVSKNAGGVGTCLWEAVFGVFFLRDGTGTACAGTGRAQLREGSFGDS